MGKLNKYCKVCGKKLKLFYNTPHKKFCSTKCQRIAFHKKHPERKAQYIERYWKNHPKGPKICKRCGRSFPRGTSHQLCSLCIPISLKESHQKCGRKIQIAFQTYKEERGCKLCKYNKYGGSLDFHHLKDKCYRIHASDWYFRNDKWKAERHKLILLCKNCHYELHNKQRKKT